MPLARDIFPPRGPRRAENARVLMGFRALSRRFRQGRIRTCNARLTSNHAMQRTATQRACPICGGR